MSILTPSSSARTTTSTSICRSPSPRPTGEKVKIPTPDGDVTLKVPPRTQSGNTTRLRGKGVARKGKEPGDLYVRFLVHVPTEDYPEVAKAIDLLADKVADPRVGMKF